MISTGSEIRIGKTFGNLVSSGIIVIYCLAALLFLKVNFLHISAVFPLDELETNVTLDGGPANFQRETPR